MALKNNRIIGLGVIMAALLASILLVASANNKAQERKFNYNTTPESILQITK